VVGGIGVKLGGEKHSLKTRTFEGGLVSKWGTPAPDCGGSKIGGVQLLREIQAVKFVREVLRINFRALVVEFMFNQNSE
jgi:hypothetical protein